MSKVDSLLKRRQPPLLCSECFNDHGLALEAQKIGRTSQKKCPHCLSRTGQKLNEAALLDLTTGFFVRGSIFLADFGSAYTLAFNEFHFGQHQVEFPAWLSSDAQLIENKLGVGFFYYAPATWRIGEIEQLEALRDERQREAAADDVVRRFPRRSLTAGERFYRLRKGIGAGQEGNSNQYDAPPKQSIATGRLDSPALSVLYGSQDLDICIHECRVTKADECYVATLEFTRNLSLLDLSGQILDDGETPFESLFTAIQLIFSSAEQSYDIARAIALAADRAGLDGVLFPSYFSSLRGADIQNLALFGHPVSKGQVKVVCVNRLVLETATYTTQLGPCLPPTADSS